MALIQSPLPSLPSLPQGEYIDINVGAALSISTMAAAGIGNLISDLAGLGLADRVRGDVQQL